MPFLFVPYRGHTQRDSFTPLEFKHHLPVTTLSLVVLLAIQDPQNREEQIQNVEVQRDSGGDLFFDGVVAHDQLCVDENVAAENQRCDATVDEFDGATAGEEGCHEAEDDQHPERAEKVGDPRCKVVLGLAGK